MAGEGEVEVRRSPRRTRTVSAWRRDGRIVIAIPARFTRAQEREWVARMTARLDAADRRTRPSDDELGARAARLSQRYLGGRVRPGSVAWSSRQGARWGSCTPAHGTIRLSDRLQGMPVWVVDYVLLHELVHLLHAGHGPAFWAELEVYPHTERARGFLEGVAYGQGSGPAPGPLGDGPQDDEQQERGAGGSPNDVPPADEAEVWDVIDPEES